MPISPRFLRETIRFLMLNNAAYIIIIAARGASVKRFARRGGKNARIKKRAVFPRVFSRASGATKKPGYFPCIFMRRHFIAQYLLREMQKYGAK
jgi:hypothetical protein